MREIIFPDINEIKGPPKIEKHGFITDHGAEMSLFVYKNRLMYMDVDNLRCIDYFTKEAFSPIADSKNTYYPSTYCEMGICEITEKHILYIVREIRATDGVVKFVKLYLMEHLIIFNFKF